jgi:hypothetical protein
MSAYYDITSSALEAAGYRPIHAGDDYTHRFTVERPAGTPLVLTGAKLWFTVKQDAVEADSQALLAYDSEDVSEVEITSGANGQFSVHLQAADTEDLTGSWVYDIKAKLQSGLIIRIARGNIEFLPNITRARA